ncbi:phage tail spike protein [Streptococcus suis]|uniref:phage tail spike protein n=1 Tax=Streptococcus suis TaxID=1307 RepID=UPI00041EA2AC|nr:phage tail spike protein [Streptococcus suis]
MIYLKDGNIPLNLAYDDDIVQEANSTYQLSFKFPLTDGKWNLLKREVFLLADDLHGEQEFFIFEAKKANGYVQVYAKQVATLLNYYSINTISVDRVPGQTVMTALAGSVKRPCPFTFFSDILDRHTFNESNVSVMDALVKEKHSIVGQWGGDLVREKYQVKLLKNGGIENESLFMYKKNLSNYEESDNINNLKTRLHLKKTIQGQTEGEKDRVIAVTVDSPLISQYSQIYEADIEVNDQDVTDEASLLVYGQRYFSSTLCDLVENSINLDVKGKSDVAVKMFDTVSVFHERFDVDLRLKITSYHFAPMSKRLKSIGFGKVSQSFGSTVANMVAGSVDKATGRLSASFEQKLQKEIDNANRHFEAEFNKRVEEINDGLEQSKAEAERYADTIKQQIDGQLAESNRQYQAEKQTQDRQIADVLAKVASTKAIAEQTVTDLMRVRNAFNQSIGQANTKALELERSIGTVRTDVMSQAQTVLAQAQAQTELTSRVATVETTANGTKETLTELSKTVNKATGDIASVTSRTKTVEDNLSQTRTQYEALTQTINAQTGQIDSINRKTADLQSGLDGVTERFENLQVGGDNLLLNAGFEGAKDRSETFTVGGVVYTNKLMPKWGSLYNSGISNPTTSYHAIYRESFNGKGPVIEFNESNGQRNWKGINAILRTEDFVAGNYMFSADVYATGPGTKIWFGFYYYNKRGSRGFHDGQTTVNITTTNSWHRVSGQIKLSDDIDTTKLMYLYIYAYNFASNSILYLTKPQLEYGTVATQFRLAQETLRSEIANYKRTAEESSAELSRQIQTVDGKAVDAKTYAQQTAEGFKTRIESLETYKNAEGTRASQYFAASRDETARQVSALRTAVTDGYVAKAKYEEDARGVTQRFEEAQVGSVNLVINSKINETSNLYGFGIRRVRLEAGKKYWFGARARKNGGTADKKTRVYLYSSDWREERVLEFSNDEFTEKFTQFIPTRTQEYLVRSYWFPNGGDRSGHAEVDWYMVTEGTFKPSTWYPAPEDQQSYADTKIAEYKNTVDGQFTNLQSSINGKVSQADFQRVQTTSQLYERIIGSTETGIKDKVARMVMADSLFLTEVKDKISGTATQVSQLNNSYAIKNLTSAGTVLNQINLLANGTNRIDGRLTHITGQTLIDNGVIKTAMIGNLDAGKITTGYLASTRIATNSIDGSKLVFDQAFVNKMTANKALFKQLFAQSAFITSVQAVTLSASQITGGLMRATNGAMEVNLNSGQILHYTDQAALKRILDGYPTQFVKFATGTVAGKGTAGVTVIGSNRRDSESSNDGGFVGIRAWNGSNIDQIDVVGDTVRLASSTFESADGWTVNTLPGKLDIDAFNADHRASSKIKVGDLWLWKNATTYSSMRDTINLIIDNLQLLHNNKSTERAYSYTLPAKV